VEDIIQALTDKFANVVGKQGRVQRLHAKKAAYGDNGGGGGGGFSAARQDKSNHEPKHKDKQRGTRGGSDKQAQRRRGSARLASRRPERPQPARAVGPLFARQRWLPDHVGKLVRERLDDVLHVVGRVGLGVGGGDETRNLANSFLKIEALGPTASARATRSERSRFCRR
jgi:hypothetical protein